MTEGTERRSKTRFPIVLRVRFGSKKKGSEVAGIGETRNISSTGMWIVSNQRVRAGVELSILLEWPSLLNNTTPLQLAAQTRVVRSTETGFAVVLERHHFRTRRHRIDRDQGVSATSNVTDACTTTKPVNTGVDVVGAATPTGVEVFTPSVA